MPFVESAQSRKSKLGLGNVSTPALAGIVALFLLACTLAVTNMAALGTGDYSIEKAHDESDDADPSAISVGEGTAQTDSMSSSDDKGDSTHPESIGAEAVSSPGTVVFVSGYVNNPGVYTLSPGARVQDAVIAAGGFCEGAATDAVNLARLVQDGEQIAIQSVDEIQSGIAPPAEATNQDANVQASGATGGLVNINTADAALLQSLPGIGEVTAGKIIASREQDGPFVSTEDLKRVSGIGEKKYEAIADLITV